MPKKDLLIGAHVSIVGGFYKAILRGQAIGATCIQIFTKSNRQWKSKPITKQDVEQFQEQQKNSTIQIVAAHASYLINLSSKNALVAEKSLIALIDELQRCEELEIPYLILHPGTHLPDDNQVALLTIAHQINQAFTKVKPKHTMLLLETMAGQGSVSGKTFQELATIVDNIHLKKHVGVCVDTCHIFAAGYNFQDKKHYAAMWKEFDSIIGLNKLKVIHMNDSKKDLGSLVDRHEHIGKGKITPEAFKLIMKDKRFAHVAKILETPTGQDETKDNIMNLQTLRKYSL